MASSLSKGALSSVVALVLAVPAGAQAAVLHDQTDHVAFYATASEDFQPSQDAVDSLIADDFTVPAGQSWTLNHVDVIGVDDGGPPPFVNVFLYANAGTLPGPQLFQQPGIPATNYPDYSAPITGGPGLAAGTYWIAVQEAGGGFTVPSWAWKGRDVQDGNQAVFRGNFGWGNGCTTFTPIQTCFALAGPDMSWKISGTASSLPVTFGKLRRVSNGTAKLQVKVPGPGTISLGGKGVKGASAQVAARKSASTVTLRIRAKGKANKTLNASGKVTLKATVTYTAPGAMPSVKKLKVKLSKP